MMTLVLTAVPKSLRGDLTKWLLEISAGVFVGNPSARIRDELWDRIVRECRSGRALLVYSTNNEQGFTFRTHNHHWKPIDFDGLELIFRPAERKDDEPGAVPWSRVRARQKSLRPKWGQ